MHYVLRAASIREYAGLLQQGVAFLGELAIE